MITTHKMLIIFQFTTTKDQNYLPRGHSHQDRLFCWFLQNDRQYCALHCCRQSNPASRSVNELVLLAINELLNRIYLFTSSAAMRSSFISP